MHSLLNACCHAPSIVDSLGFGVYLWACLKILTLPMPQAYLDLNWMYTVEAHDHEGKPCLVVGGCRFESTSPLSDQIGLYNMYTPAQKIP
jgi:hypothetical protein